MSSSEVRLDKIYEEGNKLCWACHQTDSWIAMDYQLSSIDVPNAHIDELLAWLTISAWAPKEKLTQRREFYNKVYDKLKDDPDRDAILVGLGYEDERPKGILHWWKKNVVDRFHKLYIVGDK